MTQAIALLDGDPQHELPVAYVAEPERARMTVPLLLVVGWAILFGFVVSFLMDDDSSGLPSAELAGEAVVQSEVVRAAAKTAQEVAAEPAQVPAAPLPRQSDLALAQDAQTERWSERASVPPETVQAPTARRADASSVERPGFVGTWGPDVRACGARARRRGFLPATITENGAKAGATTCRFRNGRRDGAAWVTSADCNDGGNRWTSQVRLVVNGNTLNWMSEKGPARYVRCARRQG